jgi:hypothetical protein
VHSAYVGFLQQIHNLSRTGQAIRMVVRCILLCFVACLLGLHVQCFVLQQQHTPQHHAAICTSQQTLQMISDKSPALQKLTKGAMVEYFSPKVTHSACSSQLTRTALITAVTHTSLLLLCSFSSRIRGADSWPSYKIQYARAKAIRPSC